MGILIPPPAIEPPAIEPKFWYVSPIHRAICRSSFTVANLEAP